MQSQELTPVLHIRYDQEGNPRLHISAHAVFAAINIAVVYFVFG